MAGSRKLAGKERSAMAQSRCAEVTSTAQQERPTICVKAFSCIFMCGVSLPLAVVFFSCRAGDGEHSKQW